MAPALPSCPECSAPIQTHWDWCHACGYDPDGLKPNMWVPDPGAARVAPSRHRRRLAERPAEWLAAWLAEWLARLADPQLVPTAPPAGPSAAGNPPNGSGGLPGADPRSIPSSRPAPVPTPTRRRGTIARVGLVVLVAVAAVGVVAYVVLNGSVNQKPAPPATPAFADGLANLFARSIEAKQPLTMQADLPGCVQGKLDPADVDAIAKLQAPSDADGLQDSTVVHSFKAGRSCNHGELVQALASQGDDFQAMGVSSIPEETCVNAHIVDLYADLDLAGGVSQATIDRSLQSAFQACVPVRSALKSMAERALPHLSPDQAGCIADSMSDGTTWAQLWALGSGDDRSPAAQALQQLMQAAVASCPP